MNKLIIRNDVSSMILEVRDMYVMVDRDVAKLFGMENKRINETVKRNINRFNKSNYFQLTKEEFELLKSQNSNWKSQIATSKDSQMSQNEALRSQFATSKGGVRYLPYVFTKEGLLILASILKVDNSLVLDIIDAFDRLKNRSNLALSDVEDIRKCIYEIRGNKVIFDFDLAHLYKCGNGTKEVNQAVKNNLEKFPDRYCFQITKDEFSENLRSKILTSSLENSHGGRRYLPYAFTEEGVIMLATILHTTVAVEMSIKIVDAFVAMKRYINYIALPQNEINNMVLKHDRIIDNNSKKIEEIEKVIFDREKKERNTTIYFDGQIYDAYSKILSIFKKAKKKLIIIDSYADNILLDIISRLDINVILITTNKLLSNLDIQMYNNQYSNLKVIYNNTFHDRFFIVDNIVYHCGASINRIGYKTFVINKMSEKVTTKALIDKINTII